MAASVDVEIAAVKQNTKMTNHPSASKNIKTRRETAVQGTNDSSIVSKWSTAANSYFEDSYLQYFISKQSRRAPLIHRGYYIRAVAFDRVVKNFLKAFQDTKKQIISLGTGFDSTYFRLKAGNHLANTYFCEVDFPELVKRKRLLIENCEELAKLIIKHDVPPQSPHIELSCTDYQLLGVDLTQLNTLEAALKMCGVDFDCPTLLLSECVMTYMTRRCSTELVKWAAETFDKAIFGMYEQINPDDAFGLFMQAHFHAIGSPLKCINSFPSLQSQESRFLKAGWAWCEALDMNTFYHHCIDEKEQLRVESLETFDEYEELNLKYSHYFMLTASTFTEYRLLTGGKTMPDAPQTRGIPDIMKVSRLPEVDQSVRRFGHASSLVFGQYALTSGGFGETDGRHQRLADLTVTDLHTLKSYHVCCITANMQVSRMHHASVTLSDGTTFLINGRQSPYFMCNQMLKVTLKIQRDCNMTTPLSGTEKHMCDKSMLSTLSTDSSNENSFSASDSRGEERNLGDGLNYHNGNVALATNKCSSDSDECKNLDFELGKLIVTVVEQKGDLPKERWRHACVAVILNGKEYVFLYGGKNKMGEVLQDTYLFDPSTSTWNQCACEGSLPGPRHSHSLSFWQGKVILTGGLNGRHVPTNDVHFLNLGTMTWELYNIQGLNYERYSHTSHVLEDQLILIGGVNLEQFPPGLALISLNTMTAMEFDLPSQERKSLLMLHRHTSVMQPTSQTQSCPQLVILGGGGNCFSFGTHLNRSPVLVDLVPMLNCSSGQDSR